MQLSRRLGQRGALLLAAVMLMIITTIVGLVITQLASTSAQDVPDRLSSQQALFIAAAGMHNAEYLMKQGGLACVDVTGDPRLTNEAFAQGAFTVTGSLYQPTATSLSVDISSSATTIPVASITGYADRGQIVVGSEVMRYSGVSSQGAVCGGVPPCFTQVMRGQDGTTAQSASSGEGVVQDQCYLASEAQVQTVRGVVAKSTITAIKPTPLNSGGNSGWAVGAASGGELIVRLENGTWTRYPPSGSIPNTTLRGVYTLAENDAWAVGNRNSGDAFLLHWNGSLWSRVTPDSSVANEHLYAVTCLASNECWAVGNRGLITHWNGTTWSAANVAGDVPSTTLRAVHCAASNDCWAVGHRNNGDATIVHWDGTIWSRVRPASSVPNRDWNSVACVDGSDCWAVGDDDSQENIGYWNGSTWSRVYADSSVPRRDLYGVSCSATDNCWAVGQRNGGDALFALYNGSSWSRVYPDASVNNAVLYAISCTPLGACYAVGKNRSFAEWTGSAWQGMTPVNVPNVSIQSVSVISGGRATQTGAHLVLWQQE